MHHLPPIAVALRKVALLVLHHPGVGVRLLQDDAVRLRSAWWAPEGPSSGLVLDPAGFRCAVQMTCRRPVCPTLVEARLGLDAARPVCIELFTDDRAAIGPHGMVMQRLQDGRGVLAFATLAMAPCATERSLAAAAEPTAVPVAVETLRDVSLGAALTRASFVPDDPVSERAAFGVVLDLLVACAAEEVAGVGRVGSGAGGT